MKYLKKRNNFKFDNIDESMFYMSPPMRDKIYKMGVSEVGQKNPIAKALFDVEVTDVKPDMTFIDLTDKEGFISFTQIKKAKKLFMDVSDEDSWVEGDVTGVKGKVDWIWNMDNQNSEVATGIFTKGRNQVKIGKLINKIFPGKFSDKEVEEFVNLFKSSVSEDKETEKFELVSGDEIIKWYDCDNYLKEEGILGSSCMRHSSASTFKIYVENPDVCRMLILRDLESDKILGRAIVWKLSDQNSDFKFDYFMDRIYVIKDSDMNRFKEFADNQGWGRKAQNNYSSHARIIFKGYEDFADMEVQLSKPEGSYSSYDYNNYPYMDTFAEYDPWTGVLYNNNENEHDSSNYKLVDTDGGWEEGGLWSEWNNEHIPEDEAVYSEAVQSYLWVDRATYVSTSNENNEGYYPDDSDEIIYEEFLGEYIHKDECIYSQYHDDCIYSENAVRIIGEMDDDGESRDEDYFMHAEFDEGDNFIHMSYLENYNWFEKYDEKWGWSDEYLGILKSLLVKNYEDEWILESDRVVTYKTTDDEWLTKEDVRTIHGSLTKLTENSRIESKTEYFERTWVDSDRNIYKTLKGIREETDKIEDIIKNKLYQLDDREEYIERLEWKRDMLHLSFKELDDMLELNYDYYQHTLSKDKVESLFGKLPNQKELELKLSQLRKEFIDKWIAEDLVGSRHKFDQALKEYKQSDNAKNDNFTDEELEKSFKFNFLYIIPAIENGEIKISKQSLLQFAKKIMGDDVDWRKDVLCGYRLLKTHEDQYNQKYTTANIFNTLANYEDYEDIELYKKQLMKGLSFNKKV